MDLSTVILGLIFFGLTFAVMRKPYVGIIAVISSVPVVQLLPDIPFASSIVSLLGAVTLGGLIMRNFMHIENRQFVFPRGLLWGVLFLAWLIFSNPRAALLAGEDSRNWIFTFVQLVILAWLAINLLDTPQKLYHLMWGFAIMTTISALVAFQQGSLGATLEESVRSGGLAGGANTAARYFVVAFVLMYYLRVLSENRMIRFALLGGMALIVVGVVATVSRTGFLLLLLSVAMLVVMRARQQQKQQLSVVFGVLFLLMWLFSDNLVAFAQTIAPAIEGGTDTVGTRYALWQAGIRMWRDNIISGVGIGQYPQVLGYYGWDLLPVRNLNSGAHNMYVQVLAETGVVGLLFFVFLLWASVRNFWRARSSASANVRLIYEAWMIAFVVLIIGGITKHDQYNKLLWLLLGIGLSVNPIELIRQQVPLWQTKSALP